MIIIRNMARERVPSQTGRRHLLVSDVSMGQHEERQVKSDGHRVHDTSVTEGQTLTFVLTYTTNDRGVGG